MNMPGDDAKDTYDDFEEQLLEELLQHFETGVGNLSFCLHIYTCK